MQIVSDIDKEIDPSEEEDLLSYNPIVIETDFPDEYIPR